jgi:hypothetical protein
MYVHLPNKPTDFNQMLYARKLMAAVFWDRNRLIMVELMQQEMTVMLEVYCQILKYCTGLVMQKKC